MEREYYLEDVVEINKENPRTFQIPDKNELDALSVGDEIKIIFVFVKQMDDGCRAERMWIKITNISENKFKGTLSNQPVYLKSIKQGDEIEFDKKNIAQIKCSQKLSYDLDKFAIITKMALEKRQINRATRTDELVHEEDSGWAFFYGAESQKYLDDVENASIISLDEVLEFEPLLEEAFKENGTDYEFDEELNAFLKIADFS